MENIVPYCKAASSNIVPYCKAASSIHQCATAPTALLGY